MVDSGTAAAAPAAEFAPPKGGAFFIFYFSGRLRWKHVASSFYIIFSSALTVRSRRSVGAAHAAGVEHGDPTWPTPPSHTIHITVYG